MTPDLYKFGWLPDGKNEQRFEYPNTYAFENPHGRPRIAIAPRTNQIQLLKELSESLREPFMLLYVLVVPRGESEAGRYQSSYTFTHEQLAGFLSTFSRYLESDGRQNLWIRSTGEDALLVYDRHNVIYAYGPLERFVPVLISYDLTEVSEVTFPFPHAHHYHDEFDSEAQRILHSEEWIHSPLHTADENPD